MARRLFALLGIVFCLAGLSWHYLGSVPDITGPAFQMIESSRVDDFRRQREMLIQLVENHCGAAAAAQAIAAAEPLTRESAQWTPTGQFSPAAINRFWMSFASIQKQQEKERFFIVIAIMTAGCVLLVMSIASSFRTLEMWEKLAHTFLPPTAPARPDPIGDFQVFYNELVKQKERALERAVALTFSLQRERLENKRLRAEMAAKFKSAEDPDSAFAPPTAPGVPSTQTQVSTQGSAQAQAHAQSSPQASPQGSFVPQNTSTPTATPLEPLSLEPLPPVLSPSGPTLVPMGPPPEAMPEMRQDFRPDTNMGSTIPAPIHSNLMMPTSTSGDIHFGNFQGFQEGIQENIPRPSPPPRQSASSIGRLLSEKPVSSVNDLLPYVPRFEDFSSLEQLRRRAGGVLVEIRPSLDGLLFMAQTYGPESVSRYYNSLTMFLDRCFIAFPSDLAQEKYSIYWHSRVSDLRQEELVSTIQAEMPHLQWVGDEGVISEIPLEVILHRLPASQASQAAVS